MRLLTGPSSVFVKVLSSTKMVGFSVPCTMACSSVSIHPAPYDGLKSQYRDFSNTNLVKLTSVIHAFVLVTNFNNEHNEFKQDVQC